MRLIISILIFTLFTLFAKAEIINDVKISNNDRLSKESIIVFGNIKIGSNYSNEDLNNLLKNLYLTDFFSDIDIEIKNNILFIKVTENPLIQSIVINGIKSNRIKDLIIENLKLKEKSPFNENHALNDLSKIKNTLSTNGYYFSQVKNSIQENSNNTIDLIYDIELGDKALIEKIIFTGDKIYKDNK